MLINDDGYNSNPDKFKSKVSEFIDLCVKYDIYCLMDWHGLTPGNPLDEIYSKSDEFWD
jgi:endoglucanase